MQEIASGDLCSLTTGDLSDMAVIGYAMSPDHIKCLTLDDDSTGTLGELSGWDPDQVGYHG